MRIVDSVEHNNQHHTLQQIILRRQCILPALKDALRLYDPSIAASKDRIVSSGRSMRDLVGLDRSGSAG